MKTKRDFLTFIVLFVVFVLFVLCTPVQAASGEDFFPDEQYPQTPYSMYTYETELEPGVVLFPLLDWTHPVQFGVRNEWGHPVSVKFYADCWDKDYCIDYWGTTVIEPYSVALFGFGDICSVWQIDFPDYNRGFISQVNDKVAKNCFTQYVDLEKLHFKKMQWQHNW